MWKRFVFGRRRLVPLALILLTVLCAYGNHFHNGFHFDDSHAVVDNPYIRSLHNLPRFFTDATTFSVLPANRTYRPMVSASLAIDYALGHGYNPFWFQLSTFLVFLAQLVAMYLLLSVILSAIRPAENSSATNHTVALLATAWYGLHPAMAETVNYIIQRGDVFCAFGVVAALAIYARWPRLRRTGLYLLPLAFALLSKPPAVVFPLLLVLYCGFFEDGAARPWLRALRASVPSVLVCVALMALQAAMTPKTFAPSILSAAAYRTTQPYVLLRYFGSFFLPIHLNVDTDLQAFHAFNAAVLAGFVFLAALGVASWLTARHRVTRPIAFGLLWFVITSLPTSLFVLSEVENDHRMFLPFVGLALAVCWAAALGIEALAARTSSGIRVKTAAIAAGILLLIPYAWGTHLRNQVWRTDESLWRDDVQKCPHNGRGLMNYGLTLMARGDYPDALTYFQRALLYTPNYSILEINLGIVNGALNHDTEAAAHFLRAIQLDPQSDQAHFFYGRWLYQSGDLAQATTQLQTAVDLNPSRIEARDLLTSVYALQGSVDQAKAVAQATLRIAPGDRAAQSALAASSTTSAAYWINASLAQYQAGNYQGCIDDAQHALVVDPNSALAYNNIGAAYAGLQQWDLAIQNERQSLRLDPHFTVAQNNLAAYTAASRNPATHSAHPMNVSLEEAGPGRDHGRYYNAQAVSAAPAHDPVDAAYALIQAKQPARALPILDAVLTANPRNVAALNDRCVAHIMLQSYALAIADCKKAIALSPSFQLARNNLVWAQDELAKSQKNAAEHEQTAPPRRNEASYIEQGLNFLHAGNYDQAIAAWQRALAVNPHSAVACNNIGTALMFKHDPHHALVWFNKALQLDPAMQLARNNIAWAKGELAKTKPAQ